MNKLQTIFAYCFASLLGAFSLGCVAIATSGWFVTPLPHDTPSGNWMTRGGHWVDSTVWMVEFTLLGMLTGAIVGWWTFRHFSKTRGKPVMSAASDQQTVEGK